VLPDFLGMLLLGLEPFAVANDASQVSNGELGSHIGNDPNGDINGISEKGPQESERPHLEGEAETIMIAAALGNERTIRIIQMKIAGKLFWRWFANVTAIALLLFLGQVINGHTVFLVFLFIEQSSSFQRTRDNRKDEGAWTIG